MALSTTGNLYSIVPFILSDHSSALLQIKLPMRLFSFHRKSCNGYSLPSWLSSPGPILLRIFVQSSKSNPLVERVELVTATPYYARVRYQDGRESTVSTSDLAPSPRDQSPPLIEQPPTPATASDALNRQPSTPGAVSDARSSPSTDAACVPPLTEQAASQVTDAREDSKYDPLR